MSKHNFPFDTPMVLSGPYRSPKQMLKEQIYDGHESIHDDAMAEKLGFRGGPIEGPVHFSQFEPLLVRLWGKTFYEKGCISAHYKNMVVEGEEVQASLKLPPSLMADINALRIYAQKKDGTPVLEGTASIGPNHVPSELDLRMANIRPPEKLVILREMSVGDKGAKEDPVLMGYDEHLGAMYPFSLTDKLLQITEKCAWQQQGVENDSPWGRPIVPFEMISVLTHFTIEKAGWKVRTPSVGLFADLEIRMLDGPIFANQPYCLDREIIALSESRRVECYWTKTLIKEAQTGRLVADSVLNHAIVKESFPGYEKERNRSTLD